MHDRRFSEIWNCPEAFELLCTKAWHGLQQTDNPQIRHCETCQEHVYLSSTPAEFVSNIQMGRCVSIPQPGMPQELLTGRGNAEFLQQIRQQYERAHSEYKVWWRMILDRDPFSILPLIQKGFPDFLELFIEASANFPPDRLLLDRAYRLLANSQEKARFALYLVEIGEVEMAIEIAETLNNDERFVRAESCDPPDLWA
jgi:hypothetical protein